VKPRRPPPPPIMTTADLALMERELKTVEQDFKAVESSYGEDMLHLVIATGYLSKLIGNQRIARYLTRRFSKVFGKLSPQHRWIFQPRPIARGANSGAEMSDSRVHPL
jgi:hypothetical protein